MDIKITKKATNRTIGETVTIQEIHELADMACDGFTLDFDGYEISIDAYVNAGDLMHRSGSEVISFLKGNAASLQSINESMKAYFITEISCHLQDNDVRIDKNG